MSFEEMGAGINVARHALKNAESGWTQDVAWPSLAQTDRPGVRDRWADVADGTTAKFIHRGLSRAATG